MATISVFGRLTGDPEVKQAQSGNIVHFNLADNHGKDQQGQDKVSFFRCSAFGKAGEMIAASCKKGHRLSVSGRFESRKYTDNSGASQTSLDVTVNDFNFVEQRDQAAQAAQAQATPASPAAPAVGQPLVQYDKAGNGWSLINNQWVMTHPLRPQAPAAPAYPAQQQYAAPPAAPAQPFPPFQQGALPANERPF